MLKISEEVIRFWDPKNKNALSQYKCLFTELVYSTCNLRTFNIITCDRHRQGMVFFLLWAEKSQVNGITHRRIVKIIVIVLLFQHIVLLNLSYYEWLNMFTIWWFINTSSLQSGIGLHPSGHNWFIQITCGIYQTASFQQNAKCVGPGLNLQDFYNISMQIL